LARWLRSQPESSSMRRRSRKRQSEPFDKPVFDEMSIPAFRVLIRRAQIGLRVQQSVRCRSGTGARRATAELRRLARASCAARRSLLLEQAHPVPLVAGQTASGRKHRLICSNCYNTLDPTPCGLRSALAMSANRRPQFGRRWRQLKPSRRGQFRPSFPDFPNSHLIERAAGPRRSRTQGTAPADWLSNLLRVTLRRARTPARSTHSVSYRQKFTPR
jgi:hypothetical protein